MRIGNSFSLGLETALAGGVEGAQTKYMDADDSDLDIKEDDVSEGEVLAGDIAKTDEFLVGLESLITTMEAAALDTNFGKYNLPLYHNEAKRLMGSLRLSTFGLSTENYDSPYVLSTEGFKETAGKVWQAFKDMVDRFLKWLESKFSKGSKSEKIIEKAEEMGVKAEAKAKEPEIVEKAKKNEQIEFLVSFTSGLGELLGKKETIVEVGRCSNQLFDKLSKRFSDIGPFLKDLDSAGTKDEVEGVIAGHGIGKHESGAGKKVDVTITTKVDVNLVYRESAGKIIENKSLENLGRTGKLLRKQLEDMSFELLTKIAKEDNAADKAIFDAKNTDEVEGHLNNKALYGAQRKALTMAITEISQIITSAERASADLINLNNNFYAALNVAGQTSAA